MFNITLKSGKNFSCGEGETILDAAARQHVVLEYSCRTGRCSSCKCKILEGSTGLIDEELGLTDAEKASGWSLSCVRTPTTDLLVDVEDMSEVILPVAKTLACRIHSLQKLAEDVLRVELRIPPNSEFSFFPGQYIEVIGHGGVRRSYSLANADVSNKLLELHVREVPNGEMSAYWFGSAKVNDLLRLHGPCGTFFLREIAGKDVVFLATGTGIAPVKAMLEQLSHETDGLPASVRVYWGARKYSDLYMDLTSANFNVNYFPVLSRAADDWDGLRGYVQDVLCSSPVLNVENLVVYACGSDAMIHSARELLMSRGLPSHQFRSDAFVCSAIKK